MHRAAPCGGREAVNPTPFGCDHRQRHLPPQGIFMMRNFGFAVLLAMACLAPRAEAGCVISPEGKSINVVTDNGAGEEKNCAVKCQVDTKIGVQRISCGGNTPPVAKA